MSCVASSPDGTKIASGSLDKTIRVWNAKSGKTIIVLVGHDATVNCLSFSADGKYIFSGSLDGTIRIWSWN